MQYIRTQLIIALVGLVLVGGLLYSQAAGLVASYIPAPGGTYVEGVVGAPEVLNPILRSNNPVDRDLIRLIYAGLMRFDSAGQPVPDLAASWAVTADGLSYTFVLREGLQWQDSTPLTLDDVIFTIELMQDSGFPGPSDVAELWRSVTFAKLNETTLKITLPEPYGPFLDHVSFGIVPAHVFSGIAVKDLRGHPTNLVPVGAGQFRLENLRWGTDDQPTEVLLVANPHYHEQQPLLGQVRLLFYPDEAAVLAALQRGDVMGVGGLSASSVQAQLRQPEINVYSGQLPEYGLIFLNQRVEAVAFFQEKKVRQALLAGLNRQGIVDEVLRGQAVVATGPILPGTWAYNPNLVPVEYEPKRAIELLEAARWLVPETALSGTEDDIRKKNGKVLKFTLLVADDPISIEIGQIVVRNWEQLGFRVTLQVVPMASLQTDYLVAGQFEALLISLSLLDTPDPDPYPFWHQTEIDTGQNYSGYDNRRMSELLEQARTTNSTPDRTRLYATFQARFVDETPALLLYYPVYSYAVNRQVRGLQLGPLLDPSDRFNTIADWYMITRRVIVNEDEVMAE